MKYENYSIEIADWDHFDEFVKKMSNRQWIFRGQTNASWVLESSLFRSFTYAEEITNLGKGTPKKIARKSHESMAIRRFKNSSHLFLTYKLPDNQPLEWLSIMQHYGAPTRLCDFTFSAYIAAYFAIESGTGDASVYCISTRQSAKHMDNINNFTLGADKDQLYIFEPRYPTQRLLAQQGVFLVPGTIRKSLNELINLISIEESQFILKLIIPASIRLEGLLRLRKYNINSLVLFPGLEGYCKTFIYQGLFKLSDEERIGDSLSDITEGS